MMPPRALAIAIPAVLSCVATSLAVDVEGVLPASLDQPRIYLAISTAPNAKPLEAKASAGGLSDLLGGALDEALGEKKRGKDDVVTQFAVEAFLDTGASGILLSKSTAEGLGIEPIKTPGGGLVKFFDVGVGGKESFLVGAPMYFRYGDYSSNTDGSDLADYAPPVGPIRLKMREESGLIDQMIGGLDVCGMPLMMNKVMVLDARPIEKYDKLKTSLVAPGDRSIPKVDSTVPLAYVDFARFTQTEPANAPKVTLAPNPMIGPNPFNRNDPTRPVTLTHGGKTTSATMLLDTGAASSMLSVAKARELGIEVDAGGKLTNVPAKDQFMLPIGGIGGTKNVNGFYVDALQLPVAQGQPIRYVRAPVLVLDISITDEASGQTFTLDGVFGMNYLVATADITGGIAATIGDVHDGAFSFIVIDHARKTLGLTLKPNAERGPDVGGRSAPNAPAASPSHSGMPSR